MNFNSPSNVEEILLITLANTSQNGDQLLQIVKRTKPHYTKQALYTVFRKLLKEEVIVKHGTQFSLSKLWIDQMYQFFLVASDRYGARRESVDFLALQDGDKISYSFKSPEETDRFWGHAFDVLAETMPHTEPIYMYNPHEWFILARQESELHLFNKIKNQKRQIWMTIGSRDPLDIHAKQFFDGTYLQYHILDKTLFDKHYYYLNIFGDHLIEAYLDIDTALAIDTLYKATTEWNDDVKKTLQKLVSKGKTKLTISRNERKAKKLKRILGEYFFLTKD